MTSTRPYWIVAWEWAVWMRPDFTGLTMVPFVVFVVETQFHQDEPLGAVQELVFVRLIVLFVSIRRASWRVGLICRAGAPDSEEMKTFSSVVVVSSNWPLPKPPTCASLVQIEESKPLEKSSW